jgi:dephospho-CoA kinase
MIKAGLTGNIGSGKSMVSRIFETLGVPVFHSDEVAKKFLDKGTIQQSVRKKFGEIVFSAGTVDRKKLASIVFEDTDALAWLNSLIHPKVKQELNNWFDLHASYKYVIEEAAILFESGFYKEFDKIITVSAPVELCITRVSIRDGLDAKEVKKRMQNQWSQEAKIERSHYVILNDENRLVIPQVMSIHSELIK